MRINHTLLILLLIITLGLLPLVHAQQQSKEADNNRTKVKTETSGETKKEVKKAKVKSVEVSFEKSVFPLIKKHCLPCHSEEQMNPSELYLNDYASLMAGGKHGVPVIPGNADSSLVILKLGDSPPFGDRMPLKAKQPLSEEEIRIIRDWISQGAKKN